MWLSREPRFDVACAISQGARDYQEDAITSDFLVGADAGFVVLADGMGGHAAGDVASKIVLTEVYSEMKFQYADVDAFEADAPRILREIANIANISVKEHVMQHPETQGMGATLVVPVVLENRLYWISVGDSPLYLLRNNKLTQLNEDHSMAPQIDLMVQSGMLSAEAGADHPDRNCLTSVMMGLKIPKVDCPEEPMELMAGDIIVCSSDGLQFLSDSQIERALLKNRRKRATEIAEVLLNDLKDLDDPDQDNITFCIIKVNDASSASLAEREARRPKPIEKPGHVTTLVLDSETSVVEMKKTAK
ncbi:MAG: serine/threonine-protein phosphatase [Marinosulfonomonas sp.]|nr:serine/threonine-protein phosphatase [Marinosulfonomonas sp.]